MSLTSPITLLESVAPRNLGGTIVALANSDDGGSETVRWDGKTWVPSSFAAGEVLSATEASTRFLIDLGVSSPNNSPSA